MYEQIVSPNLDTVGNIGWCLSFVEDVFGTPHSYATATDAWNAVRTPHLDRSLPQASVPIWYSYVENGINFGHVAVWVPGRGVLSSPYKANGTSQWFASIDECARVLRCTYLGWSEDLAGVQIIKEGDEMLNKNQVKRLREFGLYQTNVSDSDIQADTKLTLDQALDQYFGSPARAELNDIVKVQYPALRQGLTTLKPGKYQVN